MSQPPFKIKTGSRVPSIELEFSSGTDLTALSPKFRMRNVETGVVVVASGSMSVTNPTLPARARYDWAAGDTDVSGVYDVEVFVIHPGGLEETQPGFIGDNPKIIISEKIG